VDEEIYFAILLLPDIKPGILRLHRYAFRKNPEKHTKRSVHREGYWHFDRRVATSLFASIAMLEISYVYIGVVSILSKAREYFY